MAVSPEGKTLAVVSIDGRAKEEAEWWDPEPVFKMVFQVMLAGGVGRLQEPGD